VLAGSFGHELRFVRLLAATFGTGEGSHGADHFSFVRHRAGVPAVVDDKLIDVLADEQEVPLGSLHRKAPAAVLAENLKRSSGVASVHLLHLNGIHGAIIVLPRRGDSALGDDAARKNHETTVVLSPDGVFGKQTRCGSNSRKGEARQENQKPACTHPHISEA